MDTPKKFENNMKSVFLKTSLTENRQEASTYNNSGENSTDVSVVSVQPFPGILILKGDTTRFKARLLRRGWGQRRELIWKICI